MKVIYCSRIKKARKDIWVQAILKGEFNKGNTVICPIKKTKSKDNSFMIDIDGIPAIYGNGFFKVQNITNPGTLESHKAWVFIGTRQEFKKYQEGEHIYYAKIPKGTSYVELGNTCVICDKIIIR